MAGERAIKSGGYMTIFENKILNKIAEQLKIEKDKRLVITDYTDLDYPVYYEIKLERIN